MLHKANVVPEINLPVDSKGPQPPVVRPEFASQAQHNTGKLFVTEMKNMKESELIFFFITEAVERPVDPRVARSSNADTDLRIPFTAPVPVPAPHPVMPPIQNQHFAPAPDM